MRAAARIRSSYEPISTSSASRRVAALRRSCSTIPGRDSSTDSAASAAPAELGLSPQRLARIGDWLRGEVAAKKIPGAVVMLLRRGKVALERDLTRLAARALSLLSDPEDAAMDEAAEAAHAKMLVAEGAKVVITARKPDALAEAVASLGGPDTAIAVAAHTSGAIDPDESSRT